MIKKFFLTLVLLLSVSTCYAKPIDIFYYWGEGCHYCEQVKPYLIGIEAKYGKAIQFKPIEIFQNEQNRELFFAVMHAKGYKQEDLGTPTILIKDKALIGYDAIKNDLENNIIEAINDNQQIEQKQAISQSKSCDNPPSKKSSLKAITLAALVDSINPCAMMVLIILLSSLMVYQKDNKKKIILTAIAFIFSVFCTYFVLGLGIVKLIVATNISKIILRAVAGIAIIIGLMNLKDAIWYRKWNWAMEIPEAWRDKLNNIILAVTSPVGAFTAGCLVTMFELPCTGGPYLFGLSLISLYGTHIEQIILLAYYNFIFILPLILVAICTIKGIFTIEQAENWRNQNIKTIHAVTGIIMLGLGVLLLITR